jgi:hypothetical protein
VFNGKEIRPGYSNSMTPAELSAHLAKQGIDYGGGANAGRSRIAKDAARARANGALNQKVTPIR